MENQKQGTSARQNQLVSSTFIQRAEWKRETKPPCGRSLLNHDLIIVKRCLILANPFEVIPGLHTLTQTQLHTLKKMKLHTLRPADGHQWDIEKMTQFLIMFRYFFFLQDNAISVKEARREQ